MVRGKSAAAPRASVRQSMMEPPNLLLCIACSTFERHEIPAHHGPRHGYRAVPEVLPGCLGLVELSRKDYPQGRYTLVFLAAPGDEHAQVELTHNWDPESYGSGRNFGHLAYAVENIYAACERLAKHGVTINRPPRDGPHGVRALSRQRIHRTLAIRCRARPGRTLEKHAEHRRVVSAGRRARRGRPTLPRKRAPPIDSTLSVRTSPTPPAS